ncbi:glycoside hydrolase family 130 protein [Pseudomonadota bacterium]
MTEITSIPPVACLCCRRRPIVLNANINRVITRPYIPNTEERSRNIINRVLNLNEEQVNKLLDSIVYDFSHRHRYFRETLEQHFNIVAHLAPDGIELSRQRQLLIGSYFTAEYSVEAAALLNPSMVQVPSLDSDPEGSCRFVISFRAVGEGHISSIEFRGGIIDSNNDIYFDSHSNYVSTPEIHTDSVYNRELFERKLKDMGTADKLLHWLISCLPEEFTFEQLEKIIAAPCAEINARVEDIQAVIDNAMWLARSNYEIIFRTDHRISERVIFPVSESESGGIEDARFVRFLDDDGSVIYYATYTAYSGSAILPQLIETRDFVSFRISTLNGKQAHGKGMALFPRKIDGKYAMLSRQDGENNAIMFSDSLYFWEHAQFLQAPRFPHEFFQIGNAGSPIETDEGWLVITHGVGPMRTYTLGIELLDLEDPTKVISHIDEPILVPGEHDRDGYVPNVVYSCGGMIFQDELVVPYASADQRCAIATLCLPTLMERLRYNKKLNGNG